MIFAGGLGSAAAGAFSLAADGPRSEVNPNVPGEYRFLAPARMSVTP